MPDVTLKALTNAGDPITAPDGTVLASAEIIFQLVALSNKKPIAVFDATTGELVSAEPVSVATSAAGEFTTALWPNNRGDTPTCYKVTIDTEYIRPFYIVVQENAADSLLTAKGLYQLGEGAASVALVAGPQGEKGDTGETGPQGPQGIQGETGPQGPQGIQGETGPQGIQGETGPQGPQGIQGETGPQGIQGETGPQGIQGETGLQGIQGEKGDVGAGLNILGTLPVVEDLPLTGNIGDGYLISGYLYVWDGDSWINAGLIQGPKGDTGDTGAQGLTGPQGEQGPQGVQGVQGIKGDIGNTGAGVAVGGTTGQFMAKASNDDYDTEWVDPPAAGMTTISGNLSIYITQQTTLTITNYDSATTYSINAISGSASITGDTITYTAGSTAGADTLTIIADSSSRDIVITVGAATIAVPTITSPSYEATGVSETPTITSSAFDTIGLSDTHVSSDWEIRTAASGGGTLVASLYGSSSNKTSWIVAAGLLQVSTQYYTRVRYAGAILGVSEWGESLFTTASSFNSYIATPTATPAIGSALEGGFYTGMIWNELVQSVTSTTIGTGSKAFTVADMTSIPIVYAGQLLEVRSRANPGNKLIGTVIGAIGTTLTLNISSIGGSGTFTDWSIMAQYRVIVAPKASGESVGKTYKVDNTAAPTACQTLSEGFKATNAMVAAGNSTTYPAAWFCNDLVIGGYTDWYLPARDELELCWRNLKPGTESNYSSADRPDSSINYTNLGSLDDVSVVHGTNLNSSPQGSAYTASVPAQTSITAFRTGGAEAFAYGSYYYWSASEYSGTNAWLQDWHSSAPGGQFNANKDGSYYVRAVRRSII